ncbi:hypothetical protein MRB53_008707 [Persea americana]|uniref:Uncharacterized protein n=1 Tax=Persea americana TaxID=3435 RepID=A0ACC2MMI4_PERAE|nr:hypothetical protein MRB53_008707 [Persea americana]
MWVVSYYGERVLVLVTCGILEKEPIAAIDEDEFERHPALLSNTSPPMDDPLPIASSSHELDDDSIAQFSALTSNHAIQSLRQWIMSGIKFVAMAMIELNVYHAWEIKVM